MSYAIKQPPVYTEDDYYRLPENVRAELIDGQFYSMSAPSRIHQTLLIELCTIINNYLKSKKRFLPRLSRTICSKAVQRQQNRCGTGYQCDMQPEQAN